MSSRSSEEEKGGEGEDRRRMLKDRQHTPKWRSQMSSVRNSGGSQGKKNLKSSSGSSARKLDRSDSAKEPKVPPICATQEEKECRVPCEKERDPTTKVRLSQVQCLSLF